MAVATFQEIGGNTIVTHPMPSTDFVWTIQGVGHTYGNYATGDAWIVGPVTITDIQPASTNVSGRIKNGTQLNLLGGNPFNTGYDNTATGLSYVPALNVSPNITGSNLVVTTGSVISALSVDAASNRPQLQSGAVLTVVGAAPPANSFRPSYWGTDKVSKGTLADLDYTILRSLAATPSAPTLVSMEASLEHTWLDQNLGAPGRETHPIDNMPFYGRDMARTLGNALQSLHLDYTNPQKETIYMRLVQFGIDVHGAATEGFTWENNGGHCHGRKMPMLLAARALNDADILAYADAAQYFIFQEDQQTFYVSQADVDLPRFTGDGRQRDPYTTEMIGTPEWGAKHFTNPSRDGSNWNVLYRDINGSSITGHVLTAKLIDDAKAQWNWNVLFDYTQRWWVVEAGNFTGGTNAPQPFDREMWEAYSALGQAITLTTPTETDITGVSATVGCTTDRITGTLYAYVSTSAIPPTKDNLKSGAGAVWFDSQLNPTTVQTFSVTGLTAATGYYTYFYHEDGTETSNVLPSGVWSTSGAPSVGHVANITISNTQVPSDQTDFTVYVDLSDLDNIGSFWDTVAVGGGDIRCYKEDGVTQLPREVVSCLPGSGTTGTGEMYVLFSGTLSSASSTVIQIRVDGTSAEPPVDSTYGRNNTYPAAFSALNLQGSITDSRGELTWTETGTPLVFDPSGFATFSGAGGITTTLDDATSLVGSVPYRISFRYLASASGAQPGGGVFVSVTGIKVQFNRQGTSNKFQEYHDGVFIDAPTILDSIYSQGLLQHDIVYDGGNVIEYVDAGVLNTSPTAELPTWGAPGDDMDVLTGLAGDVYRILFETNVTRNPDWLTTEINNRNTATFYSVQAVTPTGISLTTPTEADITQTTATVGCNTDTNTGTLYAYIGILPTPPSPSDIKNGTGAVWFDNQLNPLSTQTFAASGLSSNTDYYTWFYQEDGGDVSNVLGSGLWKTLQDPLVLSNPTVTNITSNSATLGCIPSEPVGTLYCYVGTSAIAPSPDDLKNGVGATYNSSLSPPDDPAFFNAVGLSPSTDYYGFFYQEENGRVSNILETGLWTTLAPTTPVLSDPTETNIQQGSATIGCTTNTVTGVIYAYTSTSAIAPSIADLKAGTGAAYADNQAPVASVTTFNATGLEPDKTYYNYFYQENGGASNVLESGPWNTLEGLIPSSIAGIDVLECLFRTAANSNLTMVGLVQLPDSGAVGVEVNNIRATLTWDGSRYVGPAVDIANYLASNPDQSTPIRFYYGEDFQGGFAAGFSEGFQ